MDFQAIISFSINVASLGPITVLFRIFKPEVARIVLIVIYRHLLNLVGFCECNDCPFGEVDPFIVRPGLKIRVSNLLRTIRALSPGRMEIIAFALQTKRVYFSERTTADQCVLLLLFCFAFLHRRLRQWRPDAFSLMCASMYTTHHSRA